MILQYPTRGRRRAFVGRRIRQPADDYLDNPWEAPIMQTATNEADDDLKHFETVGAAPLPVASTAGHIDHDGARIWYATYGAGAPVILLHSRGHGRSTRDERPYTYELMGTDVLAVMDKLQLQKAAIIGWSDGACIGLVLARQFPARIAGVLFFGCNMDPSGAKPFELTPALERCFSRHTKDYAALSATPDQFKAFADAVGQLQRTEPNYSADDLAEIHVPVAIVQSEFDEFIKPEHAEYLAHNIPGAELILLPGVSHFAPLQRPAQFNRMMLGFLEKLPSWSGASRGIP
jgi:pimeloyl-ACP methyl ester carboxylesterase